jgi:lysylphosphatidylglycerol synthetase-like protein (DUF2156 family)
MNEPPSLRLTRLMIYLNALLWLLFGVIIGVGAHPSYPIGSAYYLPMALAAFMGTAVLIALASLLRKPNPLAYWASVAVLAVTILLAMFDEVGPADLAFILITLLPLVFLIRNRSWYLHPSTPTAKPE